jgi:hypothetical protein
VEACVVACESALAFVGGHTLAISPQDTMRRPNRLTPPRERTGDKLPFDVEKELDEVVGKFEDRRGTRMQRAGRILARALLGASLAIAAATVVIYTLHSHVRQAQQAPAPGKPIQVQILPAGK